MCHNVIRVSKYISYHKYTSILFYILFSYFYIVELNTPIFLPYIIILDFNICVFIMMIMFKIIINFIFLKIYYLYRFRVLDLH